MNEPGQITKELKEWCDRHNVPTNHHHNNATQYLCIPRKNLQPLLEQAKIKTIAAKLYLEHRNIDNRVILLISKAKLGESAIQDCIDQAQSQNAKFHLKLETALQAESQRKSPTTAFRRKSALNQYRGSIKDNDKGKTPEKGSKLKTMDQAIEEALEGIATADDVQPQEGLKSLLAAMKTSGLDQALKKAQVTWHVAEPGKHAITFLKGKVPLLQRASLDLADSKELSATLAQLTSISQGKAPQAAEIELKQLIYI